MPDSLQGDLSVALATRLNLQISLSSLPVVEEWMDPKMDRWLESVPMPTELPSGERASFVVSIASDLSRLRWTAFGHPAGFVPKMADYLSKCAVSQAEVDIINTIGERFEPARVGTWIAVRGGELHTGWQFVDSMPLAEIATISSDIPALERVAVWAGASGIEHCARLSRWLGDSPRAEISIDVPSVEVADGGFSELTGAALPVPAASAAKDRPLTLVVGAGAEGIGRLSLSWPGPDASVAQALAEALGLDYSDQLYNLQGALGASELQSLEVSTDGSEHRLDLQFAPGSSPPDARPN